MTTMLPCSSGVYQILCVPTGKIYIGSTVNLRARWEHHHRTLRLCKHHNSHLQNAWTKYGEDYFEFSVLEFTDTDSLLQVEQKWIEQTKCADRDFGFNISDRAGSPGKMNIQTWKGFVDPKGNEVTITNLFDFCRQNQLDFPSMHRLAKGKSKLKSYKGWTHRNSVRQRDYIKTYAGFIAPDGNLARPITNLAAFCREHGLDKTHMVAVAHGRICSHHGWTFSNGKQRSEPKTYTGFVSPCGQKVNISNLKAFCQTNGLGLAHMHEVKSGKRKSHKGWSWRESYE